MKKIIIIALFAITVIGISACNTYQRCPAYTDVLTETACDRG